MARRKNKQSRKYIPRNEFRRNDSPLAQGHPHYVFGETRNGKYKSLGLTTHPDNEHPYFPLKENPNPKSIEKSHVQKRVHTAKKTYYDEPLQDWRFSKEDMSIVRQIIKRYKKSTNRKPKKKPRK